MVFFIKHGGNVRSFYLSTAMTGRSHGTDWSVMNTSKFCFFASLFLRPKMNEFSPKVLILLFLLVWHIKLKNNKRSITKLNIRAESVT